MSTSDEGNEHSRVLFLPSCGGSQPVKPPDRLVTYRNVYRRKLCSKKTLQMSNSRSCDIRASWCHIQLSLLQLSLERRIDVTCSFQKYRTDAGSGNINTWDYPTGYDPGWGCWPTWWQPEKDAGHRKKLEDCCRNRQRSRGRIRSQDLSRH